MRRSILCPAYPPLPPGRGGDLGKRYGPGGGNLGTRKIPTPQKIPHPKPFLAPPPKKCPALQRFKAPPQKMPQLPQKAESQNRNYVSSHKMRTPHFHEKCFR